ncbi:replicative DNA helicase [Deinococcus petrolearius]|uniref:Replicative DNA helicase n=1 Tax=Deinococcus petrolearius TaxID=1751295 RepID=A0ABW1DEN3_9DEIO
MTGGEYLTPRVPPHSLEAEVAVLGSVMLDAATLDEESVSNLRAPMFYRAAHRQIFAAMLALHGQGTPPDLVTVSEELQRAGQLDDAGGAVYLVGLGEQVPTAAYAEHYARIVREKWMLREVISQAGRAMQTAYDAELPLEDILAQAGQVGQNLDTRVNQGAYSASEVVGSILQAIATGKGEKPLATGLSDLDHQLDGGLYPQTLTILAARPSMGKSALALNIAENVAGQLIDEGVRGQVAVVSLEMPREDLMLRVLSSAAKVQSGDIRNAMTGRGTLTERQHDRVVTASARIDVLALTMLDDPVLDANLRTLSAKLRRLHRETPLRLVLIDYLQLMTLGSGGENRQQEVSSISRALKQLAREFGCPFLVLSQLSRAVEQRPNHRPMLSDLRESGAIEQDADNILFIYRDEYYNPQTDQQGVAEVIVGKQRAGAVGTVRLQFQSKFVRFANLATGVTYA